MTLTRKDVNSKLVDVVTVADIDDEGRGGNNWVEICRDCSRYGG